MPTISFQRQLWHNYHNSENMATGKGNFQTLNSDFQKTVGGRKMKVGEDAFQIFRNVFVQT